MLINIITSIIIVIIITNYIIIIPTMVSWGSPGTVSGNVSFCIVCIAFRALRARYHLDKNTAAWAECPSRWERERFSISLMGRREGFSISLMGRREAFSISHIRFKLKTQDAEYKSCIKFSDGNRECLISNLSPCQCLFICDEYCLTKVVAFKLKGPKYIRSHSQLHV